MGIVQIRNLTKRFGGLAAIRDLSFDVNEAQITSIIGPNGAGKTTFFNLLTGFMRPDGGEIIFNGNNVTGFPPYKITRMGMARTFQLIRIFPKLSVLDNIMLGCIGLKGDNVIFALLRTKKILQQYYRTKESAMHILEIIGLQEFADRNANDLSYGQQKLVEIGRVLASNPQVLLLDEPLAGLSMVMIDQMIELFFRLRAQAKTIILVEHNMGVVLDISDRILVLNFGEKIASGSPEEIRNNAEVLDAYLGE